MEAKMAWDKRLATLAGVFYSAPRHEIHAKKVTPTVDSGALSSLILPFSP